MSVVPPSLLPPETLQKCSSVYIFSYGQPKSILVFAFSHLGSPKVFLFLHFLIWPACLLGPACLLACLPAPASLPASPSQPARHPSQPACQPQPACLPASQPQPACLASWYEAWARVHLVYPVRCAHNPAPCHFFSRRGRPARRFDPQMGSDFESLGINFEARAVILGSWTLIFRISEMDVYFS